MDLEARHNLILASLSQIIAGRDKAIYNISAIMSSEYSKDENLVTQLTEQFRLLADSKRDINEIQIYYAENFAPVEPDNGEEDQQSSNKKEQEDDNTA